MSNKSTKKKKKKKRMKQKWKPWWGGIFLKSKYAVDHQYHRLEQVEDRISGLKDKVNINK
jgi:hypothetical protein